VYLIVVTATNSGGASFDVCAVVVPHDHSPGSIASVQQQAADAEVYYREHQTAPPGYHLLGESSEGGSGAPSSGQAGRNAVSGDIFRLNPPAPATPLVSLNQGPPLRVTDATIPAEHLLPAWTGLPVDSYFVHGRQEGLLTMARLDQPKRDEGNGLGADLLLTDDRL
jgi:hypothetical protein